MSAGNTEGFVVGRHGGGDGRGGGEQARGQKGWRVDGGRYSSSQRLTALIPLPAASAPARPPRHTCTATRTRHAPPPTPVSLRPFLSPRCPRNSPLAHAARLETAHRIRAHRLRWAMEDRTRVSHMGTSNAPPSPICRTRNTANPIAAQRRRPLPPVDELRKR